MKIIPGLRINLSEKETAISTNVHDRKLTKFAIASYLKRNVEQLREVYATWTYETKVST